MQNITRISTTSTVFRPPEIGLAEAKDNYSAPDDDIVNASKWYILLKRLDKLPIYFPSQRNLAGKINRLDKKSFRSAELLPIARSREIARANGIPERRI